METLTNEAAGNPPGGASALGSARERERRPLLAAGVIALLAILSLLVVASVLLAGRILLKPASTGDALFDRYSAQVKKRFKTASTVAKGADQAAVLPDELLAGWEDEFGSDPQYWELRYWCGTQAEMDNPSEFLLEAQKRGVASANTLLLLYIEREREFEDEIENTLPSFTSSEIKWGMPTSMSREEVSAEERRKSIELHTRVEAELLELLDAAVAAGQDEAWPHYMRAIYWIELGEVELAVADLHAGNNAASNRYPSPFPVAFVHESILRGEPAGGKSISGAVLIAALSEPMPPIVRMGECGRSLLVAASLSGDAEPLAEWHRFACRMGQASRLPTIAPLAASNYIGLQADYVAEELGGQLTDGQLETLAVIEATRDDLKEAYRETWKFHNLEAFTRSIPFRLLFSSKQTAMAKWWCGDEIKEKAYIEKEILPIFEALYDVDYNTLELPESMGKWAE